MIHMTRTQASERWTLRPLETDKVAALVPDALFSLKDKVAVVTGAGVGLGAGLSAGLAAAGAKVLLTDHPKSSTAATAAVLRESGATVHEHSCDLTDTDAADQIIKATTDHFGRVDIVV